ncbi:MAG: hypothetical protein AB7N91_14805 [Candidatus Tectimicrobiota bacterium]
MQRRYFRGWGVVLAPVLAWWLWVSPAWGTVCSAGMAACSGYYGATCYNPAYATCVQGVVCTQGSTACVGRYGVGCYHPGYATCYDGLVCVKPSQPCLGSFGAQCYTPGQSTCETSPGFPAGRRERRHHREPRLQGW